MVSIQKHVYDPDMDDDELGDELPNSNMNSAKM
jgi:hypothetical protein